VTNVSKTGLKTMGEFDLIVVGGGINGAGIARDAALRGLRVLLLEKHDFGSGTSNASTGFIHGGARYLLSDLGTTRASCIDSGHIRHIAPHLAFRIPVVYPVERPFQGLLVESFFSAYDHYSKYKDGKAHCWLTAKELRTLIPDIPADYNGAATFDEWGVHAHRLVIANLRDAAVHGAQLHSYTEVLRFLVEEQKGQKRVVGVEAVNRLTGEHVQYRANMVCNATGPWSMDFAARNDLNVPLRPAKGIHVVIPRRVLPFGIMFKAIDGRLIFIVPHGDVTIVGTTDDDSFETPEQVVPTYDDVAYLCEGLQHICPSLLTERPTMTYWGVRPTLYGRNCYEDDLSREHHLFDHAKTDRVEGVVSIAGGKLATYRVMSEETTNLIMQKLGKQAPCQTAERLLPGAEAVDLAYDCRSLQQINSRLPKLLYHRYGSDVRVMETMVEENPNLAIVLDETTLLTAAELCYVIRHEWATTLLDVSRRTQWGISHRITTEAASRVCRVMGEELGWDSEQHTVEIRRLTDFQELAIQPLSAWRSYNE